MLGAIQLAPNWRRLALGLTVLFAALLLVSCGSDATATPTQEATPVPQATQTPTRKPTATPTPGKTPQPTSTPTTRPAEPTSIPAADEQTQEEEVVQVGAIDSIEGDALSLVTVDGVVLVTLSDDTIIQRFAAGSLGDLSVGQRVSIRGQRSGEEFAARRVTVTSEGTSLYSATRFFDGGGVLVGTIETIDGPRITVITEQGSFVATVTLEQTSIQVPSITSIEDLSLGQLVTVIGRESKEGGISATSILITPDVGDLLRGKQGPPGSAPSEGGEPQTETPIPVFDQQRNAGENEGITFLVTQGSEATFTVVEKLALLPLQNNAVMRTTALSGQIHLDGRPSVVEIDLVQLTSDQSGRDQQVRSGMFGDNPIAIFNVEDPRPLPDGFTDGAEVTGKITGLLNIRGVEVPLTFDLEARDDGDVIFLLGRTSFVWSDFGMTAPTNIVTIVNDEVKVEILLAVRPLLASPE